MTDPLFRSGTRSAEFFFEHNGVEYTTFPAGWEENGCDVFELVKTVGEDEVFVDTLYISPLEEVAEAVDRWKTTLKS
jgi:hypothetical protein